MFCSPNDVNVTTPDGMRTIGALSFDGYYFFRSKIVESLFGPTPNGPFVTKKYVVRSWTLDPLDSGELHFVTMKRTIALSNDAALPRRKRACRRAKEETSLIEADSAATRRTRSKSRKEQLTQREQQELRLRAERAPALDTLLPWVIQGGYCYRYDLLGVPAVCRSWRDIWEELPRSAFPFWAEIKVLPLENLSARGSSSIMPKWVDNTETRALLTSPVFLKQIFDKVNALRVAAKPSEPKRAEARAKLPRWGLDVQVARIAVWESNGCSGMHIQFGEKKHLRNFTYGEGVFFDVHKSSSKTWVCRLWKDFRLMTGIRAWRVYDGKPLWP